MISLDQVLLLEQKVESAVEKIRQLQDENDALRKKCSELTNALSSKSEQLSSFETDQNKIELGIRKALDRLTSIENSVLKAAGSTLPSFDTMESVKKEPLAEEEVEAQVEEPVNQDISISEAQSQQPQKMQAPLADNFSENTNINKTLANPIFTEEPVEEVADDTSDTIENVPSDYIAEDSEEDESQDSLGFDIF